MGAGGPSIFRTFRAPIQRGQQSEESARKEAGIRRQPSREATKREQQSSNHNKTNLKQQRRRHCANGIHLVSPNPSRPEATRAATVVQALSFAALTLMSTPVPVEPPATQINRGTSASPPRKGEQKAHTFSETCSNPLKSSQTGHAASNGTSRLPKAALMRKHRPPASGRQVKRPPLEQFLNPQDRRVSILS